MEIEERGKTIARVFQLIFCSTNRKPYVAAVRILLRIEHHEKVTIEMLELNHRNRVLPEYCWNSSGEKEYCSNVARLRTSTAVRTPTFF